MAAPRIKAYGPALERAPASVLVLRFSSAGDIILTSPAIGALKAAWPETKIFYATKREFADLIRDEVARACRCTAHRPPRPIPRVRLCFSSTPPRLLN